MSVRLNQPKVRFTLRPPYRQPRGEVPGTSSGLSSIGAKAFIGLTGLGLTLFVTVHMLGNLQIYLGPDALNEYAGNLKAMPVLLWSARLGLLSFFLTHLFFAVRLRLRNRAARPVRYVYADTAQAGIASRTMIWSGLTILAFVVCHLLHFTLGAVYPEYHRLTDAAGRHDVYSMVVLGFRQPAVSAAYIIAMLLLGLHLSHGVSSAFRSLGVSGPGRAAAIRWVGPAVAFVLAAGNVSIPVAVMLGLIRTPIVGG